MTSLDWASYPILTFPEVPDILIDLIDRPAEKPGAPASRRRRWCRRRPRTRCRCDRRAARSVPFTPEKVKEALRRGA